MTEPNEYSPGNCGKISYKIAEFLRSLNLKDKLNIIDGINVMVTSHKPTLILEFIWIKINSN